MLRSCKEGNYTVFDENCLPRGYYENSNTENSRLLPEDWCNGLVNVEVNVICCNNLNCTNVLKIILSSQENKMSAGTVLPNC